MALPSVEFGGATGRAFSFMRAAASACVAGRGGAVGRVAAGGGAEGPARAGGGTEGPALSRKKYDETPDLAALLKMSPMPRPVTTFLFLNLPGVKRGSSPRVQKPRI